MATRPVVKRTANLKSGDYLADMYGVTYDAATLENKFNAATKAQYDTSRREYMNTENNYYNQMYGNQQTALDTIRRNQSAAIATGASRGMQAANELSAVLGMQQLGAEGATELAQNRNALVDKEQAAYMENAVNAQTQANSLGMQLGTLAGNIYAADTQYDVGQMDYYSQLYAAEQQLAGMIEQANANRYTADKNLIGTKYTADQNLAGNKYTADKNYAGNVYVADKNYAGNVYTADKNYQGVKYTADQNLTGTRYTADKNYQGTVYNADKNYQGTVYNADKNYAGTTYAANASAAATRDAANTAAAATKAAANAAAQQGLTLEQALATTDKATFVGYMSSQGVATKDATKLWDERNAAKVTTQPVTPTTSTNNWGYSTASRGTTTNGNDVYLMNNRR